MWKIPKLTSQIAQTWPILVPRFFSPGRTKSWGEADSADQEHRLIPRHFVQDTVSVRRLSCLFLALSLPGETTEICNISPREEDNASTRPMHRSQQDLSSRIRWGAVMCMHASCTCHRLTSGEKLQNTRPLQEFWLTLLSDYCRWHWNPDPV